MKVTRFEGTPEEFKVVSHLFGEGSTSAKEGPSEDDDKITPRMDPQTAIRRMLKRIPVSDGQESIFKALANGKLEYSEFLNQTGRTAGEMAGVLGALGRRINNTEEIHRTGLPGNCCAILEWNPEGGTRYIELTNDALEALRAENII